MGVWVHPSLKRQDDYFDKLLQKIKAPLQSHSSIHLDLLGRILNVKALVASQLVYPFTLMSSPKCVLMDKIQSYINHYIWNGVHYFRAKFLYQPFEVGGFDMHSVRAQEKAL